jgi:hypothetical protein
MDTSWRARLAEIELARMDRDHLFLGNALRRACEALEFIRDVAPERDHAVEHAQRALSIIDEDAGR